MRVETHAFDYYRPDFSMFRSPDRTAFLTHHSIEQIPQVRPDLIDAMLATPGFERCVHFEPCGWQIPTNNWLAGDENIPKMLEIDVANRKFSEKRNQNSNLYPLLKDYEDRRIITIHVVRKYFTSHLIGNATTLIVWGPGQGQPGDISRRDDLLPDRAAAAR
jgi:hypothetical protein